MRVWVGKAAAAHDQVSPLSQTALSVTFSDGPDPDAPAPTDLWNNGLSGMQEYQPVAGEAQGVAAAEPAVQGGYASPGNYQVQRLERCDLTIGTGQPRVSLRTMSACFGCFWTLLLLYWAQHSAWCVRAYSTFISQ